MVGGPREISRYPGEVSSVPLSCRRGTRDSRCQDRPKAWLAWSSGKDSAWALHVLRQTREVDVVALLTTINRTHARVAMHAVRESLAEMQAAEAGLPLIKVPIPALCRNEDYE